MLEKQKNWSLNDARWDEFAKILLNLDRDPARIVPQLENFRFGLQVEERFKARVQQILSQPRLQAVIAILLYAGLCIFTVQSFEVEDFRLFMIISAIFVASGTFCLIKLGSRYQWKV